MTAETVLHTSFEITTGRGRTLTGFAGQVSFEEARGALERARACLHGAGLDSEAAVTIRVGATEESFDSLPSAAVGLRRIQAESVELRQPFGVPDRPGGSKSDLVHWS